MTVAVEAADITVPELLKSIEQGDEVQLLKDGKAIATLVPKTDSVPSMPRTSEQIARAQQALRDMDILSKKLNLGPFNLEEFKADRDAGRR